MNLQEKIEWCINQYVDYAKKMVVNKNVPLEIKKQKTKTTIELIEEIKLIDCEEEINTIMNVIVDARKFWGV